METLPVTVDHLEQGQNCKEQHGSPYTSYSCVDDQEKGRHFLSQHEAFTMATLLTSALVSLGTVVSLESKTEAGLWGPPRHTRTYSTWAGVYGG